MAVAKRTLRRHLLDQRGAMGLAELARAEAAVLRHLLDLPELRLAHRVAAYVSMGTEPGTDRLLAALVEHDADVLLPVLMPDNDLDWARYRSPDDLATAGRGLREPTTPRLGCEAVSRAQVVVLPGLAVGVNGHRLGRGGGSYDRALARLGPEVTTVLLLHSHEVDQPVPVAPHDRAVDLVVTPESVLRF